MIYIIVFLLFLSIIWPYLFIFAVLAAIAKIVYEIVFWINHKGPLNDKEIKELAEARRILYINQIFQFTHNVVGVNKEYRGSLDRDGRWDQVDVELHKLPSLIAQLLKYKRHEWFIWCLADDNKAKLIWANKGDDNESCYSKITIQYVIRMAISEHCNTIICMHNHPHTKERYWNLLSPSKTDTDTFEYAKNYFNAAGINIIDALCSQGSFVVYAYSFSPKYYPKGSDIQTIIMANDISKKQNYKLHKELRKIKNGKIKQIR